MSVDTSREAVERLLARAEAAEAEREDMATLWQQAEMGLASALAERDAALADVARLSNALAAETVKREGMEEALEEISTYDTGAAAGVAYTAKVALAKHGSKT